MTTRPDTYTQVATICALTDFAKSRLAGTYTRKVRLPFVVGRYGNSRLVPPADATTTVCQVRIWLNCNCTGSPLTNPGTLQLTRTGCPLNTRAFTALHDKASEADNLAVAEAGPNVGEPCQPADNVAFVVTLKATE
jgi:hypothetical protein